MTENRKQKIFKKEVFIMIKKILAVLSAVIICLAMTATAFADMPAGSLVVSGDELTGKTVTAIRMLNAVWTDDNSQNSTGLINAGDTVAYTLETAWEGLFDPNSNYTDKIDVSSYSGDTLSERAVNYISSLDVNRVDTPALVAFAKAAAKYAQANNLASNASITYAQTAANDTATLSNMAAGYYLVYPAAGSTSETRLTDAMLINVPSAEAATWNIKSVYPTVDKTVSTDGTNYGEAVSAEIGDTVSFRLESEVPEMTNYTNGYKFVFTDTTCAGITVDQSSITVTIDDVDVTSSFTIGVSNGVITVSIDNLRTIADNKVGDAIVVSYDAEVNSSAAIAENGNINRATVSYSNDPSWDGTGTNPTGTSTEDTAEVYTYEIDIVKHDSNNVRLAGATFKLLDSSSNEIALVFESGNAYHVATPEEIADSNVTKVVAITTPSDATNLGTLVIKGLAEGTYYLQETTPPNGYNKLANPVSIQIAAGTTTVNSQTVKDYSTFTYTIDGVANTAKDKTVSILNTTGPVLPFTGGLGTVIATAIGVCAVAGGIFLGKKKKNEGSENAE